MGERSPYAHPDVAHQLLQPLRSRFKALRCPGLRTVLFLRTAIRHIPSTAASALGSASSIGAPVAAERPRDDSRR